MGWDVLTSQPVCFYAYCDEIYFHVLNIFTNFAR